MIIAARGGDFEIRSGEWGSSHVIPQPGTARIAKSGVPVTDEEAMGLPAVSNVVRSPSEILASLPFLTYREKPRRRAEDSWQWALLHDEPDDIGTGTYTFFYDLNLSLECAQNAFLQKAMGVGRRRGRIEALYVIDPRNVIVKRGEDGRKLFDVYAGSEYGWRRDLTDDVILHIRGYGTPGSVCGVSLIEQHKDSIGANLAIQSFEGDYFRNGAEPPFWFTGAKNREHALDLIAAHNEQHQGAGKQYRVGAVWGNTDVKSIPLSMADAQFVEAKQMSVEEACRIWRWPKELMELSTSQTGQPNRDENAFAARVMKFYMLPRITRIERAFAADKDLYQGSGLIGQFLSAALEKADFVTRMRGYKDARQGGWITANEIRDHEDYPPHPKGDTLLETPTGSAPNNAQATPSANGGGQNGGGERHLRELVAQVIEEEMWS